MDSAIKKLAEVTASGKNPTIFYTYREIEDAFANGVVKRMLNNKSEMGRVVPNSVTAKNHIKSWEVAKTLEELGYDIRFVDNSLGKGKARLVTRKDLDAKIKYPSEEVLLNRLNDLAVKIYKDGGMSKEQLSEYIKK